MKQKLMLLLILFSSQAFATHFGFESVNTLGSIVVIKEPYMISNRIQYPLGTDWNFALPMPELAEMCAAILNTSSANFVKTGALIGITKGPADSIAVYETTTQTFSVVPDPGYKFNSMTYLICQFPNAADTLHGTFTTLPDGTTRIDQPRIVWDDILLPVQISSDNAEALCTFHGYKKLVTGNFSIIRTSPDFNYLSLSLVDRLNEVQVRGRIMKGNNTFQEILESITCQ